MQTRIADVVAKVDRLRALAEGRQTVPGWGAVWSEEELRDFEARHGCTLPAGYRSFLARIGDGGPGIGRGLVALRDQEPAALAKLEKAFPLTRGWVTPEITAELEGEGLLDEYRDYLYELPDPAAVDDGTLLIGVTSDHRSMRLVITGESPGQVWTDNRGNDFEEVLPTGKDFLEHFESWLDEHLTDLEDAARFDALVATGGDLETLRAAFPDDQLGSRFSDILTEQLDPERASGISGELALLMHEHYRDNYGTGGQVLALGECWAELEAYCQDCWTRYRAGEIESEFRAEATIQAHLALAQVALGRPGPIHEYESSGGYWHRGSNLVPLCLARWSDSDAVWAVLERLRPDVAVQFAAGFPPEALGTHATAVDRLGACLLDQVASGSKWDMLGTHASKIAKSLVELAVRQGNSPPTQTLERWIWLAACTTSTKADEALMTAAAPLGLTLHETREAARAALEQRGDRSA